MKRINKIKLLILYCAVINAIIASVYIVRDNYIKDFLIIFPLMVIFTISALFLINDYTTLILKSRNFEEFEEIQNLKRFLSERK